MGYCRDEPSPRGKTYIDKIWLYLRGEEMQGITIRNLLVFLLAVHNIAT